MDSHGRGRDGKFSRSAEMAEVDARAAGLRARGMSYAAIGRALGYQNESGARKAVARALTAVVEPAVEELRALAGEELDQLQREAWKIIATPHLRVSNSGRVAVHPQTNEPLLDTAPAVAAINALVRISDRRSKLFGLDAPVRAQVDIALTGQQLTDAFEARIAELNADIEREEREQRERFAEMERAEVEQRRPPRWLPDLPG